MKLALAVAEREEALALAPCGGISSSRIPACWYGSPMCSAMNFGETLTGSPVASAVSIMLLVDALGVQVERDRARRLSVRRPNSVFQNS